ncbi:MAG: hypothetical protein ACJ8AW_25690 [Rhodopila sp.]
MVCTLAVSRSRMPADRIGAFAGASSNSASMAARAMPSVTEASATVNRLSGGTRYNVPGCTGATMKAGVVCDSGTKMSVTL